MVLCKGSNRNRFLLEYMWIYPNSGSPKLQYLYVFLISILYWSLGDLQGCLHFRHTAKCFSYTFMDFYSFSGSLSI